MNMDEDLHTQCSENSNYLFNNICFTQVATNNSLMDEDDDTNDVTRKIIATSSTYMIDKLDDVIRSEHFVSKFMSEFSNAASESFVPDNDKNEEESSPQSPDLFCRWNDPVEERGPDVELHSHQESHIQPSKLPLDANEQLNVTYKPDLLNDETGPVNDHEAAALASAHAEQKDEIQVITHDEVQQPAVDELAQSSVPPTCPETSPEAPEKSQENPVSSDVSVNHSASIDAETQRQQRKQQLYEDLQRKADELDALKRMLNEIDEGEDVPLPLLSQRSSLAVSGLISLGAHASIDHSKGTDGDDNWWTDAGYDQQGANTLGPTHKLTSTLRNPKSRKTDEGSDDDVDLAADQEQKYLRRKYTHDEGILHATTPTSGANDVYSFNGVDSATTGVITTRPAITKRITFADTTSAHEDAVWGDDLDMPVLSGPSAKKSTMLDPNAQSASSGAVHETAEEGTEKDRMTSYDIPKLLNQTFLENAKFINVWDVLQYYGWYWQKGKGLVNFYWVRPNCEPNDSYKQGLHYFTSEESLWKYVRKHAWPASQRLMPSTSTSVLIETNSPLKSLDELNDEKSVHESVQQRIEVECAPMQGETVIAAPATNKTMPQTPIISNATTNQAPSSRNTSRPPDDSMAEQISTLYDIPKVLTHSFMESAKFQNVWCVLEYYNWYWQKGKGLVNFYYIRPDCAPSEPYKLGLHYFITEEDVLRYINEHIAVLVIDNEEKKEGPFAKQSSNPVLSTKAAEYSPSNSSTLKNAVTKSSNSIDSKVSTSSVKSRKSTTLESKPKTPIKAILSSSQGAMHSSQTEAESQFDWLDRAMTMPWPELWVRLQALGWTWDYGTGLVAEWYLLPGKVVQTAVADVDKFSRQEDVRRYLNRTRSDYEPTSQLQQNGLIDSATLDRKRRKPRQSFAGNDIESDHDGREEKADAHLKTPRLSVSSSKRTKNVAPNPAYEEDEPTQLQNLTRRATRQHTTPQSYSITSARTDKADSSVKKISTKQELQNFSGSSLFDGFQFVITGLDVDLKKSLESVIPKHGGRVLEALPDGDSAKKCTILSHPCTGFRRQTYLLALARGVPLLHYLFVVDSLTTQRRQDPERYRLPAGSCSLYPHFVFPGNAATQSGRAVNNGSQLFSDKTVFNVAGQDWNNLLTATGFKLLSSSDNTPTNADPLTTFINTLGDRRIGKFDVIYLLVDPHLSVETAGSSVGAAKTQVSSSNNRSRSRSALKTVTSPKSPGNVNSSLPSLSNADLQILNTLNNSNESGRTLAGVQLVIVTLDWFVSCLQLRTILKPTDSELFSLPTDVVRYPSVFKDTGGNRYSVGDVVLYKTNSTQANEVIVYAVGKILGFSRRANKPGIPTLVKLLPVLREKKNLTLVDGARSIVVDVSTLDIRVSVFSKEHYHRLAYPAHDDHIFCMSDEWEHSHHILSNEQSDEEGDDEDEFCSDQASALGVQRQASQDF